MFAEDLSCATNDWYAEYAPDSVAFKAMSGTVTVNRIIESPLSDPYPYVVGKIITLFTSISLTPDIEFATSDRKLKYEEFDFDASAVKPFTKA